MVLGRSPRTVKGGNCGNYTRSCGSEARGLRPVDHRPGLGIGIACYGCCVATARQPELQGRLFTNFIIGAALAEALGLIGFVLTFIV